MIITTQNPPPRLSIKGHLLAAHDFVEHAVNEAYRERSVTPSYVREHTKKAIKELEAVLEILNDSIRTD